METKLYASMTLLLSRTPTGRASKLFVQPSKLHATIARLTKKGYTGFRAL